MASTTHWDIRLAHELSVIIISGEVTKYLLTNRFYLSIIEP